MYLGVAANWYRQADVAKFDFHREWLDAFRCRFRIHAENEERRRLELLHHLEQDPPSEFPDNCLAAPQPALGVYGKTVAHTLPMWQVHLRRPSALRIVELGALSISIVGGLKALLPALLPLFGDAVWVNGTIWLTPFLYLTAQFQVNRYPVLLDLQDVQVGGKFSSRRTP